METFQVTNPETLVDHALIALAAERHQAAAARLAQAEASLREAQAAHKAAVAVSDRAVRGEGDVDPLTAEHALEGAARSLSVATKIHTAATEALRKTEADSALAAARAWAPVTLAGIRGRIVAARRLDAVRADLAAAEAEGAAANALLLAAHKHGSHVPTQGTLLRDVTTEAEELKLWADNRVDHAAGAWPWLAQFKSGVL